MPSSPPTVLVGGATGRCVAAGRRTILKSVANSEQDEFDAEQGEFDYREHPCSDRKTARIEAQRQNSMESNSGAGWIATKRRDGQWVARRVPLGLEEEPKPLRKSFVDALLMLNWF